MGRPNKILQNERAFAELNRTTEEEIKEIGGELLPPDMLLNLVCECVNIKCTERIKVPLDFYEKIKRDPLRFVVRPGHYLPEFEYIEHDYIEFHLITKKPDKLEKEFVV